MTAPTAPQGDRPITNKCPSCGWRSLFIGSGGWITCSIVDCKYPDLDYAIRIRISKAEAAADIAGRIDEWNKITTYIDESHTFDWYPADFKAFRDKRLAELKARQADTSGRE